MYLTLIILPLVGAIFSGFFGRKLGVSGSQFVTCFSVILTTLLSILAFIEVGLNDNKVSLELFKWIDSEALLIMWGFHFDSLTVSMLIPVLIVSSLVHIYSISYMSHDPHQQRFFSYLSLFTFMMVLLVTANNFLLMFVGWEGVGVCSYLLVSFWYTRIAANQSSLAAFLTNRVGDYLLTVGIFALLWSFGNIDYATVFSLASYSNENIITLIGICLLIGAMAKSSQIGLHVWLPMAMEGPTPVSALIHAATMVTAGVYLLIRSSPLIEYSSTVLMLCLWIGAITTVFSSIIGLFQQDIKKVIAYSTMSQLGLMVIAIGLSSYTIALFHLINHAFYKALLFLAAGSVIHAVSDNQDFRKYGGLKYSLPLTYSVMLIASLSLVAFPFMTGFYSKDFILESSFAQFTSSSQAVYYIATIGAMFTTLYSIKVLYLTFFGKANGPLNYYKNAHEGNIYMTLPLVVLAIFSIFFGYLTKDIFIGLGSGFFSDNSIFIHPNHEIMLDTEFALDHFYKLLPFYLTLTLSLISLIIFEIYNFIIISFKFSKLGYNLYSLFNQRLFIELFYNKFITSNVFRLGGQTTRVLDRGSVEGLGPFGLEKYLLKLSFNFNKLSNGLVNSYALYILMGLIFYVAILYGSSIFLDIKVDALSFIFIWGSVHYLNLNFLRNLYSKLSQFNIITKIENKNKTNILMSNYFYKFSIKNIISYINTNYHNILVKICIIVFFIFFKLFAKITFLPLTFGIFITALSIALVIIPMSYLNANLQKVYKEPHKIMLIIYVVLIFLFQIYLLYHNNYFYDILLTIFTGFCFFFNIDLTRYGIVFMNNYQNFPPNPQLPNNPGGNPGGNPNNGGGGNNIHQVKYEPSEQDDDFYKIDNFSDGTYLQPVPVRDNLFGDTGETIFVPRVPYDVRAALPRTPEFYNISDKAPISMADLDRVAFYRGQLQHILYLADRYGEKHHQVGSSISTLLGLITSINVHFYSKFTPEQIDRALIMEERGINNSHLITRDKLLAKARYNIRTVRQTPENANSLVLRELRSMGKITRNPGTSLWRFNR